MSAIDTAKEVFKLVQQLDNVEIVQKVIELQSDIQEMQEKVSTLRKENEDLKNVEKIDGELALRNNAYWRDAAPASRRGPFCTKCWDVSRKLVVLHSMPNQTLRCMECEINYSTPESDMFEDQQRQRMREYDQ